jgi:hypothetical protein
MSDLSAAPDANAGYVQQLLQLLGTANAAPTVQPLQYSNESPNYDPRTNTIRTVPRALGHELVHALQWGLASAANDMGNPAKPLSMLPPKVVSDVLNLIGGPSANATPTYKPVSSKLSLQPSTAATTPRSVASRLEPQWAEAGARYRATDTELVPFEVPSPGQRPNTFGAPGHLGPTLRTELDIALELLARSLATASSPTIKDKK